MDPTLPASVWIVAAEAGVAVALVVLSAFVSAAEASLFSLPLDVRARMAGAVTGEARRLGRLAADPRAALLSLRLVDTSANVAAVVLAAHVAGHLRASGGAGDGAGRAPWGLAGVPEWAPVALAFLAAVLVLLVFGEALPRIVGTRAPEAVLRRTGGLAALVHAAASPLTTPLARWSNRVEQRLGESAPLTSDDLKAMAEIAESEGTLDGAERSLIEAVVDFGETTVREIMTARADIVALPLTATLADAAVRVRESGHSRLPVIDGTLDRVVGLLVAKDLLAVADPAAPLSALLREPFVVPDSLRLDALMEEFRRRRTHVALAVDEYGSTSGLVTMEDVLEEVVGEIRDERDTDERPDLDALPDGTYRLDGRLNLEDLADALGLDLPTDSYDFDTVAGLILHVAGRVPEVGQTVEHGPLRLTVDALDGLRIGAVRLALVSSDASPDDAAEDES